MPSAAQQSKKSQPTAAPAAWSDFVRTLDATARADSVVGASAVMVRGNRIVAHHEYGWQDRARNERVATETIFHWASITKTLTAVAIMQLRDRGRLSLDDRVTSYIPELRQVHDAYGSMDSVTIRMLLSHTAGFQGATWPYREGKPWEPFEPTRWEQLVAMMPYQELLFAPGARYSYSNPGFVYLGRIIELVTGDPYEVYIQKNLWLPLGLTHSFFGVSPYHLASVRSDNYTVRGDGAHDTVTSNGREFDPGITISNSGWNAPLGDLATWVSFLAGQAKDSAGQRVYDGVLRRSSIDEMWRAVVQVPDEPGGDAFGLSFFVRHVGSVVVVGHTGEQAGFRSVFYVNPKSGDGVVAVFNTTNEARPERSAQLWATFVAAAAALVAPQP